MTDSIVEKLLQIGAGTIVLVAVGVAFVAWGIVVAQQRFRTRPGDASSGPAWMTAGLVCVALYLLGRLLDPILASTLAQPQEFPDELWSQIGWFEWKLLGRPLTRAVLPLDDHPGVAVLVHAGVWSLLAFVIHLLVRRFAMAEITWTTLEVPAFYRWIGASTPKRADQKFREWLLPICLVALPIYILAGLRMAVNGTEGPAHGSWVVIGLVLWTLFVHFSVHGRAPASMVPKDEEKAAVKTDAPPPAAAPLQQLSIALEEARPGVQLTALERQQERPAVRADLPPKTDPLVRELFKMLTGSEHPFAHQTKVLEHLMSLWALEAHAASANVSDLSEEHGSRPVTQRAVSSPHALMLAAEGAGRTTVTILAAVHVFLSHGASTLAIVRDRRAARAWARRATDAIASSSVRWNIRVAVAGEDLDARLVSGRTPSIVVADLEALESDVLGNSRSDNLLRRLGLVVADDVETFTGVAEMHLQMCMRRLWALLPRLRRATPYPAPILATAARSASGIDGWARHVLAAPLTIFEDDAAPTRERVLLRRRDLVDHTGADVPLSQIIDACDRAGLPWHLRQAGDVNRGVRRVEFDLGGKRRHHTDDPTHAAVVIVEGTYPDVHREADRLAHAGLHQTLGPTVMVLAPPGDEEMVLHEEATDAANRDLIASLPRAVTLSEPRVVRSRHVGRALGREQEEEELRMRFGRKFVDEMLSVLAAKNAVQRRTVTHIDAQTERVDERVLVRTADESGIGEPIAAACVTEAADRTRVVDAGTAERLVEIDTAIAGALYPPGQIFVHPRGRYAVLEPREEDVHDHRLPAEHIDSRSRTTPNRTLAVELGDDVRWSQHKLGGRPLRLGLASALITERIEGMRRFGPGPELLDQNTYPAPLASAYGTDLCLIALTTDEGELPENARVPLVAAVRMMLPCYVRGADGLVDVGLVAVSDQPHMCIFDRAVGAAGYAEFISARGLGELLRLARLVLERLVGPEFVRLRHIHDVTPSTDPAAWDLSGALLWLDTVLDAPPEPIPEEKEPEPTGVRVEYTPGEGPGDLGRLWVSGSGRADDLVWTRHRWLAKVSIGGQPRGDVAIDFAVERQAIARARREAADEGERWEARVADLFGDSTPRLREAAEASPELTAIRTRLASLAGDAVVEAVLGLVAGMPLSPRPLRPADRAPLVVLARRQADREAKLLLACALLPRSANACIVEPTPDEDTPLADAGPWLRYTNDGNLHLADLSGPRIRPPHSRGAEINVILDWSTDPPTKAQDQAQYS